MDKEMFEKLMYEEWRGKTLTSSLRVATDPRFDILWDLRDNLYDIFHPLGISGNGIHDVAKVAGDVLYAFLDDGELSIVAAYTADTRDALRKFSHLAHFDFFVCYGWYNELTYESIKPHALRHAPERTLKRFVAKNFNNDVLHKLHMQLPQFSKEKQFGRGKDLDAYFNIREENKVHIENMILEL